MKYVDNIPAHTLHTLSKNRNGAKHEITFTLTLIMNGVKSENRDLRNRSKNNSHQTQSLQSLA